MFLYIYFLINTSFEIGIRSFLDLLSRLTRLQVIHKLPNYLLPIPSANIYILSILNYFYFFPLRIKFDEIKNILCIQTLQIHNWRLWMKSSIRQNVE